MLKELRELLSRSEGWLGWILWCALEWGFVVEVEVYWLEGIGSKPGQEEEEE